MDNYLTFVVAHVVALIVTVLAVAIRAKPLFVSPTQQTVEFSTAKALVALQHSGMTLTVLSGIALLYANQFHIETWFYAKIILFLVTLSALAKAFKKGSTVTLVQRKAGLTIAFIASLAIVGLVFIAPT